MDQAVSLDKCFIISRHNTAKVVKLKVNVLQLLMYKSHNIMSLLRDLKLMSRDRIFLSCDKRADLTGVLPYRTTLLERLQHNLLSLRYVSSM